MFGWFSADAARASVRSRDMRLRVVARILGDELEGHRAAETGPRRIHDAHAAGAEHCDDPDSGRWSLQRDDRLRGLP